jgi:hypothetical protein
VTATKAAEWSEVARRTGEGVEVAVLWNGWLNRVKVLVSDGRLCHHLDLEVSRDEALESFRQQFAFAVTELATEGR